LARASASSKATLIISRRVCLSVGNFDAKYLKIIFVFVSHGEPIGKCLRSVD